MITADSAPLIIGFLFKSFKQGQNSTTSGSIPEWELISLLTDYLFEVNQNEKIFPRKPKDYLTDWANFRFLRKYPGKNDEFEFELTPATENALKWIDSLERPEFIGTESRPKTC
jgi:hypothetical protein